MVSLLKALRSPMGEDCWFSLYSSLLHNQNANREICSFDEIQFHSATFAFNFVFVGFDTSLLEEVSWFVELLQCEVFVLHITWL